MLERDARGRDGVVLSVQGSSRSAAESASLVLLVVVLAGFVDGGGAAHRVSTLLGRRGAGARARAAARVTWAPRGGGADSSADPSRIRLRMYVCLASGLASGQGYSTC
jgi:hypothetical protein